MCLSETVIEGAIQQLLFEEVNNQRALQCLETHSKICVVDTENLCKPIFFPPHRNSTGINKQKSINRGKVQVVPPCMRVSKHTVAVFLMHIIQPKYSVHL